MDPPLQKKIQEYNKTDQQGEEQVKSKSAPKPLRKKRHTPPNFPKKATEAPPPPQKKKQKNKKQGKQRSYMSPTTSPRPRISCLEGFSSQTAVSVCQDGAWSPVRCDKARFSAQKICSRRFCVSVGLPVFEGRSAFSLRVPRSFFLGGGGGRGRKGNQQERTCLGCGCRETNGSSILEGSVAF